MDTINNNNIKDRSADESFFRYVCAKKEKLTSALYLVTSFITDQEPIKWKLREKGLELLSDINAINNLSDIYQSSVLEKVDQVIEEISSLLSIATAGNFVSEMNVSILKKEYHNFSQTIHDRLGSSPLETLLSAPAPEPVAISGPVNAVTSSQLRPASSQPVMSHQLNQPHSKPSNQVEAKREEVRVSAPKITLRHNGHDDNLPLRRPVGDLMLKDKTTTNSRQESIISFVTGRGWTPISDIAGAVPDVSVKTVQRELAELVATGVLKKTGDRRWSRYTLARA